MLFKATTSTLVAAATLTAILGVACTPPPPAKPVVVVSAPTWPTVGPDVAYLSVMGPSKVDADTMVKWYKQKTSSHTNPGKATVSVAVLAQMFLDEGRDGKVRGDIAFVQAMIETGWLRFSERMPMEFNNFSGIGAVDGGTSANKFRDARTGVRAQIQHLRAYADSSATASNLGHPLVDPRFKWVKLGIAPNWTQFGNGIWASDPGYAGKVKGLYDDLLASRR